ncbi:OLC1v1037025C2 [Oldenlandia corymbosa var. corymbosa]|uniref:OLC1v1037025C2 n=1 Tax=Oldenlandia corymbosa var. corymbosa TaxID=529605 RepID=A0AAV1CWR7_OLDCO|nr:OLC1v1037025C2 [Oldenlandia corymbosa var. corymbosa]
MEFEFEPFLWLLFLFVNLGLIALNYIQFFVLTDLEDDYLNSYEASYRINRVVVYEYLLHGAFCILFLLTGNWFFFLVTLFPAYINAVKFMKGQHIINVTEIVTVLNAEKKIRKIKLGFYVLLFVVISMRIYFAGTFSFLMSVFHQSNDDIDIRSSILEF